MAKAKTVRNSQADTNLHALDVLRDLGFTELRDQIAVFGLNPDTVPDLRSLQRSLCTDDPGEIAMCASHIIEIKERLERLYPDDLEQQRDFVPVVGHRHRNNSIKSMMLDGLEGLKLALQVMEMVDA